jgi:hypothetical protein
LKVSRPLVWRVQSDVSGGWRIVCLATLLVFGVGVWGAWTWRDARALHQQQSTLAQPPSRPLGTNTNPIPHRPDFTPTLPEFPRTTEVVQSLHRASADARTTLVSLQLQARPATPQQLARAELSVTLRGPYLSVRQVLDDVLGRYAHVGVSRLRMRRAPASAVAAVGSNPAAASEVEASAVLSIWARPQVAAPTAQPAAPGR